MKTSKLLYSTLLLFISPSALAQQASTIRGNVKTSDGNAAEAVTVSLKGKTLGAITSNTGDYSIGRVKAGEYTVQVSAVGLKTAEQTVSVTAGESATVDFVL
ncbi:MAG: carboxypeptidase-like regulatory domain-containing protein, partial [Bacteroidetes bacterium]|nr:carboxypeptidase-like regulatory domain-containing protein [Fibrella sp.]